MTPIHFVVNSTPLGSGLIDSEFVHAQLRTPSGFVYVCTQCGEAWAKATVEGQPYVIYSKTCEKHETPFYFDYPGSIWLDWDKPYQLSMTKEVLMREVVLHCDHWKAFQERRETP